MVSLHEVGGDEGLAEQEESGHDVLYGTARTQHSATLSDDTTSANNPELLQATLNQPLPFSFQKSFSNFVAQQGWRGWWK